MKVILHGYKAVQVCPIMSQAKEKRDSLCDIDGLSAALAICGLTYDVFETPIYWGMPDRCSARFKEYFKVWRLSLQPAGSRAPLNLYLYMLKQRRRGSRYTPAEVSPAGF